MRRIIVGTTACAAVSGMLIGISHLVTERRRKLTMQPIGISANAGVTFTRCRQDASLRRRGVLYRGDRG